MKKFIALVFMTAIAPHVVAEASKPTEPRLRSEQGWHLVVKFANPQMHQALLSTPETSRVLNTLKNTEQAQAFAERHHVHAQPVVAQALLQPIVNKTGLAIAHHRSVSLGYDELTVNTPDAKAAISALMATGQFLSVEPVYRVYATAAEPNDPLAKEQFYLRPYNNRQKSSSNFLALHNEFQNNLGRKVRFAVLDAGSWPHEDVQFAPGYNFVSSQDEPNRGRGADTNAKYTNAEGTSCQNGHGLSVASILAATSNNDLGITGAFPSEHAEIVPVRVLGCANGSTTDVMDGLLWAAGGQVPGVPTITQAVDVANLSLGSVRSNGCSKFEQDILNQVAELGVTVVIAAGNEHIPAAQFAPGACANAITVGSINTAGDLTSFSNYGSAIDVVAEGNIIQNALLDTELNNKYSAGSGTSFSAPLVSALAGAMIAQEPSLTGLQVEARLKTTAIKNPSQNINSICRFYGCGDGLVQVQPAMGYQLPAHAQTYRVEHRYQGFSSAADLQWMTALQPKASACQTLRYTLGAAAIKQTGISYKIYRTQNGGAPSLLTEIEQPEFIHATSDDTTLSFQRCENNNCSEPVMMPKGSIELPKVCL